MINKEGSTKILNFMTPWGRGFLLKSLSSFFFKHEKHVLLKWKLILLNLMMNHFKSNGTKRLAQKILKWGISKDFSSLLIYMYTLPLPPSPRPLLSVVVGNISCSLNLMWSAITKIYDIDGFLFATQFWIDKSLDRARYTIVVKMRLVSGRHIVEK